MTPPAHAPLGALIWHGAATVAAPGLRLMLRRRAARGKEMVARLPERRGLDPVPRPPGRLLWLHAASVGETVSVLPVLGALAARAPELHVLFTTGTVTAAALLQRRVPELGLGRVLHRFVPLDVPAWASRFLDHWRPDAAAFVESELWPNLLAAGRARGVPMMLVNARLSARSFAAWRRAPGLARAVVGAFERVWAASEADAQRLRALGARAVEVPGDLKFAAPPLPVDEAELARLRAALAGRPAWLAASTHPGEDAAAAEVHRALAPKYPGLLTVVAPRHPERGGEVAAVLGGAPRRSAGQGPGEAWVADTVGDMGLLYRLAPVVFVGKSLVGGGGQNPLEPARLGCAVACGPHMENFAAAVAVLQEAGALHRVQDAAGLVAWVDAMLRDPAACTARGEAARAAAGRYADLPERTAQALLALMERP